MMGAMLAACPVRPDRLPVDGVQQLETGVEVGILGVGRYDGYVAGWLAFAAVDIEVAQPVLAVLELLNPNHRRVPLISRDNHDARGVPRQDGRFEADSVVFVLAADGFSAAAERVEERHHAVVRNAHTVVGDHAAIDALLLDALPLNAEKNACRPGLDAVLVGLADPLQTRALVVRAADDAGAPRRL
jgi:hypothetical protein